jgi:histidine triad (HIT) family protein
MSCLFCKIIAGEIPAELLYSDELVVAFEDINPQAPTHILIIPRSHFENAAELARNDGESLKAIFNAAGEIAKELSISGYRTVFNTGADAGQSVFHAHLHLLAGRAFGWPPG